MTKLSKVALVASLYAFAHQRCQGALQESPDTALFSDSVDEIDLSEQNQDYEIQMLSAEDAARGIYFTEEGDTGVVETKHEKSPFMNPSMAVPGLILMFILITISNAGGLSGAGSNIPIMLIFFELTMDEAVPVSAFVAVTATVFRFILNFNQKHPTRPDRVSINYEVVELTMPAVFYGSFLGVLLKQQLSDITKECMFGVTVAWSIQTTFKKALQLIEKEKQADLRKMEATEKTSLLNQDDREETNE